MKQDTIIQLAVLLQDKYGLSNPLVEESEDGIEGNTYIITAGKQRYVAKMYASEEQASVLAAYQNALHEANVPVPPIVKTQTDELIANLGDQYVVLCEFAQGSPIGWHKEFANIPSQLSHDIAQALARMHHVGQSMRTVELGHVLSASQELDDFLDSDTLEPLGHLRHIRQTLIHGDLTRENVFIDLQTSALTAIIDFGDAHYDYVTYDIAIALTQIYVTKSWGIDFGGVKDFLTAYTQHMSLTPTERQTILPLMTFRNLVLLREIELQLAQDRDDHEDLESIRHSLQTKLDLLKEHSSQIKDILEEEH